MALIFISSIVQNMTPCYGYGFSCILRAERFYINKNVGDKIVTPEMVRKRLMIRRKEYEILRLTQEIKNRDSPLEVRTYFSSL